MKTTSDKSLFAEHEAEVVHQNVLRDAVKERAGLGSKSTELVLKKAETQIVVAKPSAADQGGQSQQRKLAESQDDKYRITYEARQAISGTITKLRFCQQKILLIKGCKPNYYNQWKWACKGVVHGCVFLGIFCKELCTEFDLF